MQHAGVLAAVVETGGYINILKLVPLILLLLVWARLMTWVDKDTVAAQLPRELMNTILFFAGLAGFLAFFILPNTLLAYGVLVFILLASAGTYLVVRHQQVGLKDLKKELQGILGAQKKKKKEVKPGEVQIFTKGGNPVPAPDPEDPARAGYDAAQEFLTVPLRRNAEKIEVRPAAENAVAVRYVVDGVAYNAPAMDKVAAAEGITFIKKAAGLDISDKRKPQTGMMKVVLAGVRHEVEVSTAGSTAGESMRLIIDPKKRFDHKLDTMGFTAAQLEVIRAYIQQPRGIVLLCAPREQGLTTMLYTIVRAHDAFVSHIQTIEHSPKEDLEGITQNRLAPNTTPAEELKQVEWVTSQQPDIIMMDEIANPASAAELCRFALEGEGRRVYVGMRSPSTFDALTAWCKLVGDVQTAVAPLVMIVAGRLLRRLCDACKVAYEPDREYLRKLNMDPERVKTLYQARTQPMRDQKGNPIPCNFCQELAFKGRFGVYEVLLVDDEVRQIALEGFSVNRLRAALRKQKGHFLQELALARVEAGDTSVQEVVRVLRGDEAKAARPKQ